MAAPVSTVLPSSAEVLGTLQLICEANAAAYVEAANSPSSDAGGRIDIPASAQPFVKSYGPGQPEPLTWFHSRSVPAFSLSRLSLSLRHPNWSYDEGSALIAAALMVRFSAGTGLPLTALMMHRLFLAAALVTAKVHHDVYPRNGDFAAATGLQLPELNRLEAALLRGVEWRVGVDAADVAAADDAVRGALRRSFGAGEASYSRVAAEAAPATGDAAAVADAPPATSRRRVTIRVTTGGGSASATESAHAVALPTVDLVDDTVQ